MVGWPASDGIHTRGVGKSCCSGLTGTCPVFRYDVSACLLGQASLDLPSTFAVEKVQLTLPYYRFTARVGQMYAL